MIIKVVEGEHLPPMCYRLPDDTEFTLNHPISGWIMFNPKDGQRLSFNMQYVVAILPDTGLVVDGPHGLVLK